MTQVNINWPNVLIAAAIGDESERRQVVHREWENVSWMENIRTKFKKACH